MAKNNFELGVNAESKVLDDYLSRGFVILDRNWHGSGGEIDLIVRCDSTLVFCEVKYRSSEFFGAPEAAVTFEKQRRIRQTAIEWLSETAEIGYSTLRFDVAAVTPKRITFYEACF